MADAAIAEVRTCTKCGIEKPLAKPFFGQYRNGGQVGFRHVCGLCRIARSGSPTPKHRSGPNLAARAETKREYNKRYYAANRERLNEDMRAWRTSNPEWDRARWPRRKDQASANKKAEWASLTPEQRLQRKDKLSRWRAENPQKVRAVEKRRQEKINDTPELRAKAAARMREWTRKNPEAAAAARDRRRAREVGAEGHYTKDDVRDLLRCQGRFCFYCEAPLKKFECDHFIPLCKGGSNWPSNLRLSCSRCNCSKGGKLPWEWKPERFLPP